MISFANFLLVCLLSSVVALATTFSSAQASFPGEKYKLTSLPLYGEFFSNNYAGSINISDDGKTTAFFWFAEAEVKDPTKAPLIFWFNGGPGFSSIFGFLTEIGPYLFRLGGEIVANDWRWTKLGNVLVIDSPAGVGYSQTSDPTLLWNDTSAAQYNLLAHQKFLELFPQFKGTDLYVTGESYAGRYGPTFTQAILDSGDQQLISSLKGQMLGNPCTGFIGCENPDPTLDPFLRGQGYLPWSENVPMDPSANYNPYDLIVPNCDMDGTYLKTQRFEKNHPLLAAYGKRKRAMFGEEVPPYGPCAQDYMTSWLNRADVKQALNAPSDVIYAACSSTQSYDITNVSMAPIYKRLAKTTNIALMIYSGLSDSIVNHAQTEQIIHDEFQFPLLKQEYQAWNYPYPYNNSQSQLGGFWLEYERFSFAGVRAAGHEVPQYQPPAAYELLYSFLTTGKPGRM